MLGWAIIPVLVPRHSNIEGLAGDIWAFRGVYQKIICPQKLPGHCLIACHKAEVLVVHGTFTVEGELCDVVYRTV